MAAPARCLPIIALLLAGSSQRGLAVDWKALQPQGYVSDFARAIDPASRAEIERYAARVEALTKVQMAFVAIPTLEGEPIEDVANTIFRHWGVGQKGSNEGILLLLSTRDRRSRLEVGYGLEPDLPDGFAGSILREMRPALRQNHFGEAMLAAAHTIGERVARAKNVALDTAPKRRIRREARDSIPWPVILGGIAFLFWMMGGRSSLRGGRRGGMGGILPALILGQMLGGRGGGHWRSGGGFGGYDSGGGFGGFGGGDSGGGGASSGW
ncbi:MAG: TPM domain-containing protein [Bryobacteraceae bacterium]